MTIRLIYFSVSGNTRSFVSKLQTYAAEQHQLLVTNELIELIEITDQSLFTVEKRPFVTIVPTYLDGGNGLDNGTNEIMTTTLREYLEYANNYQQCLGVVGSGNKNFNWQYCLTAKQYAEAFAIPFLADYELRGTADDVKRIYEVISKKYN